MSRKTLICIIIVGVIAVTLLAAGYVSSKSNGGDVRSTINDTLASTNLTYYSIAGKPMNYTIGQNDIRSIEPTTYEGKNAWKVRVGESLSWDLTMDANGTEILYVNQLFRT